ncbi:MAG: amidohydrolase family protein, partial [Pseudomonadota bacterium]
DALADAATERDAALASIPSSSSDLTVPAVPAPHALYSASPDLLRRIFAAAAAVGRPTSIHVAEDAAELDLLRDGTGPWAAVLTVMGVDPRERAPGLTPLAYLDTLGAFANAAAPPLLVHMVHAGDDDRRRAAAAGATVVLCPRSNLHIGGRVPDVTALVAAGVRLAMGTDSLASVPDLSLWGEIATLSEHFPALPASTWLAAATHGGARALGMTDLGRLEPDCRPGLLDVVTNASGAANPEDALVRDPRPSVRWLVHA